MWDLLDLAQEVTQQEAASRLGRSVRGVEQKMKGLSEAWRGRMTSARALAEELGCSPQTVTATARALNLPTCGAGSGKRYLLDGIQADRLRTHLSRKLSHHAQQRSAGRSRHAKS